jgi:hypothetical protein
MTTPSLPDGATPWLTYSSGSSNTCVEYRRLQDGSAVVRHSQHREGPFLTFTEDEWDTFVGGLTSGRAPRVLPE